VDGDNLIINLLPEERKLPNIDFSKMVGRFDNDEIDN